MSKIARRQFIQLSAVAAAGCFMRPGNPALAQDQEKLSEDDPMAQSLKYVHDASSDWRANIAEFESIFKGMRYLVETRGKLRALSGAARDYAIVAKP